MELLLRLPVVISIYLLFFFFQAEDGIRDLTVTGVQTCALPILIVVLGLWIITIYNGLVAMRQRVNQAFSDIDVQTKQRHDLVPNLVETVKGYRSEEHTSELQSQSNLVCRLLLEKKKKQVVSTNN